MMIRALLVLVFILFAHEAYACRALYQDDVQKAEQIAEKAHFVGLVKIKYKQEYPNGLFKEAGLEPFMAYATAKDFIPDQIMLVKGDEEVTTSCDYTPAEKGEYQEVIVFKNDKGELELADQFSMGLGKYWDELRSKVHYVGGNN